MLTVRLNYELKTLLIYITACLLFSYFGLKRRVAQYVALTQYQNVSLLKLLTLMDFDYFNQMIRGIFFHSSMPPKFAVMYSRRFVES